MTQSSLAPVPPVTGIGLITERVDDVRQLMALVRKVKDDLLIPKIDFGVIPGTGDKPTLLLPGMEKLMRTLHAVPVYIPVHVVRDYDKGLFHYEYECQLKDVDTGKDIPGGRGIGLCTSYESSFRWRWVSEDRLPAGVDKSTLERRGAGVREPKWAIDKGETGGKYGKPVEYWERFRRAIEEGTARRLPDNQASKGKDGRPVETWEIGGYEYRIQNPDIADQVNAIMKRAKKRALGDAVKGGAGVSEYFTVDVEDFYEGSNWNGVTIDAMPVTTSETTRPAQLPATASTPVISFPPSQQPPAQDEQPPWWTNPATIHELVDRAIKKGFIEKGQGAADLLKLIGAENWKGFASSKDAGLAILAAVEKLKASAPAKTDAAPAGTTGEDDPIASDELREIVVNGATYDGRKITFQAQTLPKPLSVFSRNNLAVMAGDQWAKDTGVREWTGTEQKPETYRFEQFALNVYYGLTKNGNFKVIKVEPDIPF